MGTDETKTSLAGARFCAVAAAVLWSTGGAFAKLLREDTGLGLNLPQLHPLQIAAGRVLCAGAVLLVMVRRRDVSFRPMMAVTALSFAAMNASYVSAVSLGKAANAVLLQYTAPMWMYVASIWLLGEKADRRGGLALALGLLGVAVLVYGGWQEAQVAVVLLALASGVTYAGVLLGLRVLRGSSATWVTALNFWVSGLVLVPFVWQMEPPTLAQSGVLILYGVVQMGLPYWLMARGLRTLSPQEAGTLTLLEPLLAPLWAYLVSPGTEMPTAYTLVGGLFIVAALAYRYWPRARG
jgi:drug/metabolite transporter (DMT)-like permease